MTEILKGMWSEATVIVMWNRVMVIEKDGTVHKFRLIDRPTGLISEIIEESE